MNVRALAHAFFGLVWIAAGTDLAGCVPIPYRPRSEVVPASVAAEPSPDSALAAGDRRWPEEVAASVRRAEPRVIEVPGRAFLGAAFAQGEATLSALLARDAEARRELPADYLLLIGRPSNAPIDDRGAAALFPMFPAFIVGYERRRSLESVGAVLVALRGDRPAECFAVESRYSEVAAGLAYGFATIAMPQSAVKLGLANEVARILRQAEPSGPVRLAVVEALPRGDH